jgi:hypothetical protein
MTTIRTGSISHGTMRDEDLIPAFIDELPAGDARVEYVRRWEQDCKNPDGSIRDRGECGHLLEDLFNALDAAAPAGHYFGSHPGDGSDYGFWPVESDEDESGESGDEPDDEDYELRQRGDLTILVSRATGRPIYDTPDGRPAVLAWLLADGYFPNVWAISDHGNAVLVTDWT